MNTSRPYYFLGGKRHAAVCERVRQGLNALTPAWWAAQPRIIQLIAVTAWENTERGSRASRLRYVVRDGQTWLGYIAPDSACVKLAEGWLGCEISAPSPLVEALERQFCQELFTQLRATPSASAATFTDSDWSQLPTAALQAGAGTAVIEIDIDGVPLVLVVPVEFWPDLMDVAVVPATRTLQQAACAVSAARIRLDARLPAVQVPLCEVSSLAAGDFLDLQLDLTGVVRVLSGEVDLGLCAVIGQRDARRAIRLSPGEGTTT